MKRMKRRLNRAGFRVHKEAKGFPFLATGVSVNEQPWKVAPNEEKSRLALKATEDLVRREKVFVDWVESVVGVWSWFMVLGRGGFSIFSEVYPWMREQQRGKAVELPKEVKKELLAAARLFFLFMCPSRPSSCHTSTCSTPPLLAEPLSRLPLASHG